MTDICTSIYRYVGSYQLFLSQVVYEYGSVVLCEDSDNNRVTRPSALMGQIDG